MRGRIVAQRHAGLSHRLRERFRMGGDLHFTADARLEPEIVIAEGQSSKASRAHRLQRTRYGIELFARQPLVQMVEHAPSIIADRLQAKRENLILAQRSVRCAFRGFHLGIGIGIDVKEAKRRRLCQIAEPVKQTMPQLAKRLATESADADKYCRPERADLRLRQA
jgi:hypothetical protein